MMMEIGIDLMMKVSNQPRINLSMKKLEATRHICYFIAKQIVLNDFLFKKK